MLWKKPWLQKQTNSPSHCHLSFTNQEHQSKLSWHIRRWQQIQLGSPPVHWWKHVYSICPGLMGICKEHRDSTRTNSHSPQNLQNRTCFCHQCNIQASGYLSNTYLQEVVKRIWILWNQQRCCRNCTAPQSSPLHPPSHPPSPPPLLPSLPLLPSTLSLLPLSPSQSTIGSSSLHTEDMMVSMAATLPLAQHPSLTSMKARTIMSPPLATDETSGGCNASHMFFSSTILISSSDWFPQWWTITESSQGQAENVA